MPYAIFEGIVDPESDDGGAALIAEFSREGDEDTSIFVRLQSWDENKLHPEMRPLIGQRIRITIEVM